MVINTNLGLHDGPFMRILRSKWGARHALAHLEDVGQPHSSIGASTILVSISTAHGLPQLTKQLRHRTRVCLLTHLAATATTSGDRRAGASKKAGLGGCELS